MKRLSIPTAPGALHNESSIPFRGEDPSSASVAVIMVHGRGATAESILDLAQYFLYEGVTYVAPQATGNLWYPYSFLVPLEQNEPYLSAALQRITEVVDYLVGAGIPERKIALLGFSQGASLSMEWAARTGRSIGAVYGLSGGLIGPPGTPRTYSGSLAGTEIFIGCSDVDFHIPKERVKESADVFNGMHATVTMRLYPDMDHTVNEDEIAFVSSSLRTIAGK
jgi:predicted esterase